MYLNKSENMFCYCLNDFDTADVTTFKEDNKQLNRQTNYECVVVQHL